MNVTMLMGRLTRDPQIKTYGEANDKKFARFTLAVDRRGRQEEGQQSADFIGCVAYGKLADFADNYLRQGTKILLRGRIQTGNYTNADGVKVYTTDVIVDEIEFAESKRAADGQTAGATPQSTQTRNTDTGFMDIPSATIDEEVPFA